MKTIETIRGKDGKVMVAIHQALLDITDKITDGVAIIKVYGKQYKVIVKEPETEIQDGISEAKRTKKTRK